MTKSVKEGTPGYYIRELRQMYKLTQSSIESDLVNRSKIAHIELNNKNTIITESDCKAIANSIIKVVGSKLKEDKEFLYLYFYDHEKYLAAEKAQEIFKVIKSDFDTNDYNSFNKNFKLFDDIFIKYDLPEIKIKSFMLVAMFEEKKNNFNSAYLYAFRALDNALLIKDIESQINASIKLSKYLYYMEDYTKCIDICSATLKKCTSNLSNMQFSFLYYNLAQSYRKISEYDLALINYEKTKKYISKDSVSQHSDLQNSIAMCYSKKESNDKAIQILLDFYNDLSIKNLMQQIITLDTLIDIAKNDKDKNIDIIRFYADKLRLLLPQINNKDNMLDHINHASVLYYNLAQTYDILNEFNFAESFYNKSIELSKFKNDTNLQYKCLLNLFDLYIKYNEKSRINLLATNLLEALTNISMKEDNRFILKILKNFISCDQTNESLNIINLLLKEENI